MVFKKGHKINNGRNSWNKGKINLKEKYPNWGMTGKVAWNKGLTKETDNRILKYSINGAKTQKGRHYSRKTEFKKGGERIKKIRAKQILPTKNTSIEIKIQKYLQILGIEFFTHQYMKIEHGYQCDILIPSMNLVIECDGNYWHKYPVGNDIDHVRTSELIKSGFKVLRLWENEIRSMNINEFKERIL